MLCDFTKKPLFDLASFCRPPNSSTSSSSLSMLRPCLCFLFLTACPTPRDASLARFRLVQAFVAPKVSLASGPIFSCRPFYQSAYLLPPKNRLLGLIRKGPLTGMTVLKSTLFYAALFSPGCPPLCRSCTGTCNSLCASKFPWFPFQPDVFLLHKLSGARLRGFQHSSPLFSDVCPAR